MSYDIDSDDNEKFDFPDEPEVNDLHENRWDGVSKPDLDDFETLSDYEDARAQYNASQGTQRALGKPPQGALAPWEDDPRGVERKESVEFLKECAAEEAAARDSGDEQKARDWNERGRMTARELRELGPSPRQRFVEEAEDGARAEALKLLFDEKEKNNEIWKNPRILHDSAVLVDQANMRSDGQKGIILPMEKEPFGPLLPVKNGNCVLIELSPELKEEYRVHMAGVSADSIEEKFMASWQWLRENGLHATGFPQKKPKAAKVKKGEDQRPASYMESLSQAEYERQRAGG